MSKSKKIWAIFVDMYHKSDIFIYPALNLSSSWIKQSIAVWTVLCVDCFLKAAE